MRTAIMIALALPGVMLTSSGAVAQSLSSVGQDGIRRMVVYGTDPCPQTSIDEIVICARRPDRDRYRIPERFRQPDSLTGENEAWAYKAEQLELVGAAGTGSCSTVGPGGSLGCFQQLLDQARAARRAKTQDQRAFPD